MDAPPSPVFSGLLGAFRALGDGLLQSLEKRIQLVALELQEEKLNFVRTLLWLGAIFVVGLVTLVFAGLGVVQLCGEENRLLALWLVAALHGGALFLLVMAFRRHLKSQPTPFAATLDELGKDRACIRKAN